MKKRFVAFLLVLIMVLGMLPVSAFAADDGVSPQALNTGHKIDVTFTVLYVGNEFNIGYNYGTSEKTQFVCQYSTPHSDTAYNNHTIAISDIKAAADRASVNSGYQIVGWSKESNANPTVWPLNKTGTTACNKGTTIYLVAKDPNPQVTYTLNYHANGGDENSVPASQTEKSNTGKVTFTVSSKEPTRDGYKFLGWNGNPNDTTVTVKGGKTITTTAKVTNLYAVWESKTPPADKPVKPGEGDFEKAGLVSVECSTKPADHAKETYDLKKDTFTIGEVEGNATDGYTCEITVTADSYVSSYVATHGAHTLTGDNTKKFTLTWVSGKWVAKEGGVTFPVQCEQTPPPEIPGDQKPNIEEANAKIRVQCIEYPSKHNPYKQNYRILPGSYDDLGWDRTEYGYIYSIRLNRAKYIAQFDQEIGRPHTDTEPNEETRINWRWENGAWHLIDGPDGVTADIKVKCAETPVEPKKPTALDGSFAIVCKNNEATHAHKADYIATPSQYTISDVQTDEQGYYVTATVTVAPNLVAYNTLTGAEHRLVNEQDATLTITFRYDPKATMKWRQQGDLPVVEVICEPKAPTADELKKLEMAVQVKCVVDDSQQHTAAYGLLGEYDEDYFVGEPRKDGDDWLCDISYVPDRYVAAFNTTFQNLKHVQNDEQIVPVTLIWVGGSWQLKTQGRVHVTEVYTVTYTDGVDGEEVFADQVYSDLRKDSATPVFNGTPTRTGYTFTFWSREGQLGTDVTGQTVNGWTNLVANWKVTPHNIYAYARLNSYFAPLTTSEFDTPVTLNEATLSRLGLGSYNSLGYISIGSFTFDAMPLTSDLYFADDAELSAVAEKLATDIALETGVSDKIAEKIAWTALYKTVNEEDMAPGYPAEAGYQLSGNLDLATVMFKANGENVTGMPEDNYVYNDVVGLYDFYFAGDTFTLPTTEPTREGYSFEGWSVKVLPAENDADHLDADGADDAADETLLKAGDTYTITAGGVIFTAQWEARTDTPYTVEHYLENLDGSYALDTTEPLKGTTDTTVTAAAKSYDNFTYDSTVPGTVASGNIAGDGSLVLKLFYTRNTYDYTVRHIKQLPDGTYDEANAEVETLSGKFEALAAVTAKDYGSHYPTNDAGTKQNIKIEKNLTIDVKYDLDNHTLTFETNGGSAIDPVTVRHGNAVARPADPTKDKYTFIGWYVDPEFTEEYDFATVLEADKTIYAKFELTSTPIGDIYVRYDVLHIKQLPDGSYDLANAEVEHLSAKKDTTVTAVVKDYRATHHINVNSTLSKLTDTAIQPYPGADGKPVYTILSVYYDLDFHTLTFDTMGGSRIDPVTVRHGNAVAKPKDPVNGGYIFDGWYTDKTYRTPYNFATVLTQDTTIYAKWFLIALPGVTVKKTTPKLNTSDHFAYVQGYPDGTVKPTGNITRAETAAILFRLMDEGSRKTYYSTKSGFRDVATGSWYNTYVATLNNAGVITDSSNGYFRPNEAITRAELAAMLANFTETAGAANYFNDVSARYWAANAIAICAKLGWITGYPDGSFRPDRNVTRAELMAMINRATGRAPKSADAFLPGMKTWSDNTADKWYYLDVQEATNSHSYTVKDSEKWTALNADPNWSLYE